MPQLDNLDTTLTVEQNLVVALALYRVPRAERKEAIERALRWRASTSAATPRSTSSPAGCAAAC